MEESQPSNPHGSQQKKRKLSSMNRKEEILKKEQEFLSHWKKKNFYRRKRSEERRERNSIKNKQYLEGLNELELFQSIIELDVILEKIKDNVTDVMLYQ